MHANLLLLLLYLVFPGSNSEIDDLLGSDSECGMPRSQSWLDIGDERDEVNQIRGCLTPERKPERRMASKPPGLKIWSDLLRKRCKSINPNPENSEEVVCR